MRFIAVIAVGLLLRAGAYGQCQAIGSPAADRARVDEILGRAIPLARDTATRRFRVLVPDVRVVSNSAIPYSLNDGPLWAGRGWNASATAGVASHIATHGITFDVVAAPTATSSANKPFDFFPGTAPGRSAYSSPWHTDAVAGSADLPLRFGSRPLRSVTFGESSVRLGTRYVAAGVSTSSQWWGPGQRSALLLSNNAGGIPRLFLETPHPVETRIGRFTAELFVGSLTESLFFDTVSTNDYRSVAAARVVYEPTPNVTVSLGRVVYAPSVNERPALADAFNVFRSRSRAFHSSSTPADQIVSATARWVFPASGLEVYGEFARQEFPRSLADLTQTPDYSGGFTVGAQWALPRGPSAVWRVQAEASSLEQNVGASGRVPADFYTGRIAAQGYTQRGQIIGAAIGPGASGEWLAGDYLGRTWSTGVFVGRTRWEDDAMYRQPFMTFFSHDVSIYSGVRGGVRLPLIDVSMELTVQRRLNYLFQNVVSNPAGESSVRVQNLTLAARLSPR